MLQRRLFLRGAAAFALMPAMPALAAGPAMTVTKSPTCGCCTAWADLARQAGYAVETVDVDDVSPLKTRLGVPEALWGCHTVEVEGYVVEGHVPFPAVARLLRERPQIVGIAAPGMPMGSPGMGWDPAARYDVIAFGGTAAEGEVYFRAGTGG
ncbi:MAG: DUF411 domain-containing protein [Shimia sp.]